MDDDAPLAVELVRGKGHARGGRACRKLYLRRVPSAERAQTPRRLAHLIAQRALEGDELFATLFESAGEIVSVEHESRES
ncbi:MAG: hypothetical protein LC802_20355 [Acidobacteria bacterium]|nr:hypothetical protein [Acidobacteriota bacterium]